MKTMKNSQKGFIVPLLLVIIAVLVVGGGVYVYENKKAEVPAVVDTGTQQTNTQTPPVINTPTNTPPSQTGTSFKVLSPNAEDEMAFFIKLKNTIALSSNSPRPVIKITANFKPGGNVPGFAGVDVSGSNVYEVKISSKLQVIARGLFTNSTIPNSGPLPPKVGSETTYTIIWSLANMTNDADNVVVKSYLPPYVSFKNIVSPADVNISFDKTSGEIIWRAGRVLAGTGYLRPAMEVAFQVRFTPSENQINDAPVLINATNASGRDTFTAQSLSSEDGQITIELPDDPGGSFNQKKVVP